MEFPSCVTVVVGLLDFWRAGSLYLLIVSFWRPKSFWAGVRMRKYQTVGVCRRGSRLYCLVLLAAAINAHRASASDFNQTVGPILTRNCAEYHAEEIKTSGYSIASQASVIAGGSKHGREVYPGNPARSPLVRFLKGELQPAMPLGKTLAKADLEQIEGWIQSLPLEESPKLSAWRWPFEQPRKQDPPRVKNADWVRNPIDAFILTKLERKVSRQQLALPSEC